jgi:hypothetical protein
MTQKQLAVKILKMKADIIHVYRMGKTKTFILTQFAAHWKHGIDLINNKNTNITYGYHF